MYHNEFQTKYHYYFKKVNLKKYVKNYLQSKYVCILSLLEYCLFF